MGILPLWKPRGMTSFQAVRQASKILGTKKAGHTGTLDPDVNGVLPVCVGRATKIVQYLTEAGKMYTGEVTIGWSTETEDSSGQLVSKDYPAENIPEEDVDAVLTKLHGEQTQIPPMYSAVKVKGRRLYEYARAGEEVERPARLVTIHELKRVSPVTQNEDGAVRFSFKCSCSKGTYIRTLAVTIGEELGFPAHMSNLTRNASGSFTEADCVTFEEMEQQEVNDISQLLIPVERAFEKIPSIVVNETDRIRILQGGILPLSDDVKNTDDAFFSVLDEKLRLIALYKKDPKRSGMMRPEKMIRTVLDFEKDE
ncbi:tRNA pseudouridine(55) synthase TruB [Salisediminibacterium beveridgei]|nr:tRNA pseudouridine(55) synthase TruB [Salisediminibacterium beveridgei]